MKNSVDGERHAVHVLDAVDEEPGEDKSEDAPPRATGPNLYRFAAVLARDVRLKMGLPKPTEANRMVAWELLMKACEARDVRKVDRLRFAIIAVDMVFVPNSLDVLAAEIRRSVVLSERLAAADPKVPWWKRLLGKTSGLNYHRT